MNVNTSTHLIDLRNNSSVNLQSTQQLAVNGFWDLGRYTLNLDASTSNLSSAFVTFIKRKGRHEAKINWHESADALPPQQIYQMLTSSFPSLEIYIEHKYLSFILHVVPVGQRPQTLAEKYAHFIPGFSRELLQENPSREKFYVEWLKEDPTLERMDFLWSLLEASKRKPFKQDVVKRNPSVNAAFLINRLDSFAEADLQGVEIPSAKLISAIFNGAIVSNSDISAVNLHRSSLDGADFRGSACRGLALGRLPTLHSEFTLKNFILSSRQGVMVAHSSHEIYIWEIATCQLRLTLSVERKITALSFSDEGCIVVGDDVGYVHLWKFTPNLFHQKPFRRIKISQSKIRSLYFSIFNPSLFVVCNHQNVISVWNIDGSYISEIRDFEKCNSKLSICLSPSSTTMAILKDSEQLSTWEFSEGKKGNQWLISLPASSRPPSRLLRFSKDGQFVSVQIGVEIHIWKIDGQKIQKIDVFSPFNTALSEKEDVPLFISEDFENILFFDDVNNGVRIRNVRKKIPDQQLLDMQLKDKYVNHQDNKNTIVVLSSNENIVSLKFKNDVFVWEINSLNNVNADIEPPPMTFRYTASDNLCMATFYPFHIIRAKNEFKTFKLIPLKFTGIPLMFSNDGSRLICYLTDNSSNGPRTETMVADSTTGKLIWRLPTKDERLKEFVLGFQGKRVLSHDNCFLAANVRSSNCEKIEVWDINANFCLYSYNINEKHALAGLFFTKDNKNLLVTLVSEKRKRTKIICLDLMTHQIQTIFRTDSLCDSSLSPPSNETIVFTKDNSYNEEDGSQIIIWDYNNFKILHTYNGVLAAYHHARGLVAKWGPSTSGENSMSLLHTEKNKEIQLLKNFQGIPQFEFSANGRRLVAKIPPIGFVFVYGAPIPFSDPQKTVLYIWEIETIPYLHVRLVEKYPHELSVAGAKFNQQNDLSDIARRVLLEKGAEYTS